MVPSHKFYLICLLYIKVFIGILGEGFEIQFCAIFYVDFNKDLIKFEIEFVFICIIKVFIGILGESIEIQVLALFYIDFNQGFNHIWNRVFLFLLLLSFSLEY